MVSTPDQKLRFRMPCGMAKIHVLKKLSAMR